MLLGLMRQHARSWLIKVLMTVIVLVFIFYFGYSFKARQGLKIALVNGEVISGLDYDKAYRNLYESFRRQYKDRWNENMVKAFDLKNMALHQLINQILVSQEAKKIGLSITKSEIQKAIMGYPAFQVNGRFDIRRYKMLLSNNRMKPEDFEAGMAQDLLNKKLEQFLFAFVDVTDQELLDYYTYINEKIQVGFVRFKPDSFKRNLKFDKAAMEDFFKKNREKYRIPEKIRVAYMVVDPESFKGKVTVTEDEIKSYYEYHIDDYKEGESGEAKPIEEVRSKIIDALEREKCVDYAQERGWDLLAQMPYDKKLSQYAAENGFEAGITDYFSRNDPIPGIGGDIKLRNSLFLLEDNDTTDLITLAGKFYVFQVDDRKASYLPKIEEVAKKVRNDFIDYLAAQEAKKAAEKFLAALMEGKEWYKLAKEEHLDPEETRFFTRRDPIPKVGGDADLKGRLFSLNSENRYLDYVFENDKASFVFRWLDRKGIDEKKYEEEKETFRFSLIQQMLRRAFESRPDGLRRRSDIKILKPVT